MRALARSDSADSLAGPRPISHLAIIKAYERFKPAVDERETKRPRLDSPPRQPQAFDRAPPPQPFPEPPRGFPQPPAGYPLPPPPPAGFPTMNGAFPYGPPPVYQGLPPPAPAPYANGYDDHSRRRDDRYERDYRRDDRDRYDRPRDPRDAPRWDERDRRGPPAAPQADRSANYHGSSYDRRY